MYIKLKNKTTYLLLATTLLSILFNIFFLWKHWGISILLFNIGTLSLYYFFRKGTDAFNKQHFVISSITIIILSIPYIRFDFGLFKFVNSILIIFMYGFLVNGFFNFDLGLFIKGILIGVFMPFTQLHRYIKDASSHVLKGSKTVSKVLIGLLFAGLIFIVILPLLLSSDIVFQTQLGHIFGFMDIFRLDMMIPRILLFLSFGSYLYAQLIHTQIPFEKNIAVTRTYHFDSVISNVFLTCINLVYVFFSFIQIKYLFMGHHLPNNMSYSEYARQGFFQLVIVTAINMLIIILFNKMKQHHLITNSLLIVTVICTYIMTFSAFYRMNLYESTYGYTRLRLLVYLFLIAELIVLLPMIIGIVKQKTKFLEIAFLTVFIYYLGVTFINIDAFVAEKNIYRFNAASPEAKKDFDIKYLDLLSKDALPSIDKLIGVTDDETANYFRETILIKYHDNYYKSVWFEYNLSNERAYELYQKYYPEGYDINNMPSHYRDTFLEERPY